MTQKIIRYLVSGSIAGLTDLAILYVLVEMLQVGYLVAATVAFVVTLIVSFVLQKYWTFEDGSTTLIGTQIVGYITLSIANIFVNTFLMFVGVEGLHVPYLVVQILAMFVIAAYGFFVYQWVIFRPR